ncbi:MAG: glycosyltransferase family 4 protein [Sumerlaeia bacterium]
MRILHTMASHRWTGAAEPAARQALAEQQCGAEVLFALSGRASLQKKASELGLNTSSDVRFHRKYFPWRKIEDVLRLRALIRDFRPDVLHCHLTHDHCLAAAALAGQKDPKPVVVRTFHRGTVHTGLAHRALLMPRTQGAVAISREIASQLCNTFGMREEDIYLHRGGVDLTVFRPTNRGARLREKWGISADAPVIGLISRIRIARGHEWLLEAAADALPLVPQARLVICGRGNWQKQMVKLLKTHPARDQIVYAGYIYSPDLEDAYNAFDVSLLLRPGNDGTCRSALETMACGRPVIAGDMGALKDLLEDGRAGWMVPNDDRPALANAMVEALTRPDLREERGRHALWYAREFCNVEKLGPRMLAYYKSLLRRRELPEGLQLPQFG